MLLSQLMFCSFFFFNDTATTEIYTLSLHDALPISAVRGRRDQASGAGTGRPRRRGGLRRDRHSDRSRGVRTGDRKSTRLNSSHGYISYAVFCLKKKKKKDIAYHNAACCQTRVARNV